MTIDEAAKATRRYAVWCNTQNTWAIGVHGRAKAEFSLSKLEEAQAACDRLNLIAVLEALREPSEGMVAAGVHRARRDQIPAHVLATNWRAMIDAAIKEVRKAGNDA